MIWWIGGLYPLAREKCPLNVQLIRIESWFLQMESKVDGSNSSELIENFRYRSESANVSRTRLVAELSLYKDPEMLSRLGFPVHTFTQRESLSQFVFVTGSNLYYFHSSMDAIARIQMFFPNTSIYFYDLSDGDLDKRVQKASKRMSCAFIHQFPIHATAVFPPIGERRRPREDLSQHFV